MKVRILYQNRTAVPVFEPELFCHFGGIFFKEETRIEVELLKETREQRQVNELLGDVYHRRAQG